MTTGPKAALAVCVVALSMLLAGCQSVSTSNTLAPSPSAPPQVNPVGPRIPVGFAPTFVQLSASQAALHVYIGSVGGSVSGGALGSARPCPGRLVSGLVAIAGKTQVAAVFICPPPKPGEYRSPSNGGFQQVPANRIDALLAALSYRPTSPGLRVCTAMATLAPPRPLVILEGRSGIYYDVALRSDDCNFTVPDDVTKAIDAALAPVTVHSVLGVRGTPAGPLDLGKPCRKSPLVSKGTLMVNDVPAITTVYVCPPAPSVTGNTKRYYKAVPDPKTAALLKALAGPDDKPGGPFWNCAFMNADTGYAIVAQTSYGSLWRIRVPTAGCGQPTIAMGKAIDAAIGTHVYDHVKGYGL